MTLDSTTLIALWQRQIACRIVWPGIPLPPCAVSGREYLLAQDGLYVRATRPELAACIPVVPCPLPGLGAVTPGVDMQVPRVPAQLVRLLVRAARASRDAEGRLVELLSYLVYDEGWVYYVPPQEQHRASLRAELAEAPAFAREMARTALIEVHTHGRLPPFFSGTDQLDEQGRFRLFLVIGHLAGTPTCLARVGVFGHFWPIRTEQVLELPAGLQQEGEAIR